ncbi:hypothetical protein SLE2022_027330 [Rubroshorea leprosula]
MADAPQPHQLVVPLELEASLEDATSVAKQPPAAADPIRLFQFYFSLQVAHHHLSSFLSSATGAANDSGSEAMQVDNKSAKRSPSPSPSPSPDAPGEKRVRLG